MKVKWEWGWCIRPIEFFKHSHNIAFVRKLSATNQTVLVAMGMKGLPGNPFMPIATEERLMNFVNILRQKDSRNNIFIK